MATSACGPSFEAHREERRAPQDDDEHKPPRGKPRGVLRSNRAQILARENHFDGSVARNIFCDSGVRLWKTQEAPMRFYMNSYLLVVGTVVGSLSLLFGGGIVLTKTAIKDTPAGPSKIERAARPEPAPPQV